MLLERIEGIIFKQFQKNVKIKNHIDEDLEKSESYSDSNDETESDIDNDEEILKKYFNNNKNLIVCVNRALLGFYLCHSV